MLNRLSDETNQCIDMRKFAVLCLFVLNALSLSAQETDATQNKLNNSLKERKSELGLLFQIFEGSDQFRGQAMMGLQFKRRVKPNMAFRVLAAYNPYNYSQRPYFVEPYSIDSVKLKDSRSSVDMFALGIGVETQRRFYKRVFFFAGLELRAGYGEGTTVSHSRIVPVEGMYRSYLGNGYGDYDEIVYRRAYAKLIPGVGVKIVFNKINFGLETQFASIGIDADRSGRRSTTLASIDAFGNMGYRFQANYRF